MNIKEEIEKILKGCFDLEVGGFNITKAKTELTTLVQQKQREAIKGFAVWFEAHMGGLYRGEMEQKYEEYLSQQSLDKGDK